MYAVSTNLSRAGNCRHQGLTSCSHSDIDEYPVEFADKYAEEARPCRHFLPHALYHLCLNRQSRHCHKRSADRFDMGPSLGWN